MTRKKTIITCFVILTIVVIATIRITGIGTLIILPNTDDVVAIRIDHNYMGTSVYTTERADIETIMSVLSTARRTGTWITADHERPHIANFLTINIYLTNGGGIYHLYGGRNIFVAYEGRFRMNKNGYNEIHQINVRLRQ